MTQISWTRQLGLAVTLVALGTTAYWLEYRHKPAKEASEEKSKKIFPLNDTQVQSIALIQNQQAFVFNCSDLSSKICKPGNQAKWEITSPSKVKADDTNVNSLLSALNNLNVNRTIDLKDESPEKRNQLLKEYGLDSESRKSAKRVETTTSDGTIVLYLGQPHPIGDGIFALKEEVKGTQKLAEKPDESQVYVVPTHLTSNLDHDFTYWREKRILTLAAHDIASFQLNTPKGNVSGSRQESQWILESQKMKFPGDTESVDSLLNAGTYLTAKNFAAENKEDAKAKELLKGLSSKLEFTLQKDKGSDATPPAPIKLSVFERKGKTPSDNKLFATASNLDPVFEIDSTSFDRINKDISDLRMKKLITSMDRFAAKRLEFSGTPIGQNPVVINNNNGTWEIENQSPGPFPAAQKLLDQLSGNRIKDYVFGSKLPTGDKDGIILSIGDGKIATKNRFVFWKNSGKLYAKNLNTLDRYVYVLDPTIESHLPWNKDFFKNTDTKKGEKSGNNKS